MNGITELFVRARRLVLEVDCLLASQSSNLAATVEVDNLSDAKLFDNYGAQRPGRAVYLKVTGELR